VWSMEYCTGLFVWGLEVCAQLVVGGLCSGGSWWKFKVLGVVCGWVFSVVVRFHISNGCVF